MTIPKIFHLKSRIEPGSGHLEFVVDKVALGQVFSKYFGFPAKHSTNCSTLIIIQGWYNRPTSGLSNSGLDSTAPKNMMVTATSRIRLLDSAGWCCTIYD
jgi:hypothetical protein